MEVKQDRPKETSKKTSLKKSDVDPGPRLRAPQSGPRPNVNPNLDSFEAVMEAMETELGKARLAKKPFVPPKTASSTTSTATSSLNTKGKGKATDIDEEMDDEDADLEAEMDAELRAALEREEGDSGDDEPMDYGMIRNFLESFKSQAGLAGPVSNLAGRLEPGWLPRDES